MKMATNSGKAEIANPELGENPSVETLHRPLFMADEEKVRTYGK